MQQPYPLITVTYMWDFYNKNPIFVCLSVTDEDPSQTMEERQQLGKTVHSAVLLGWMLNNENYVFLCTNNGIYAVLTRLTESSCRK